MHLGRGAPWNSTYTCEMHKQSVSCLYLDIVAQKPRWKACLCALCIYVSVTGNRLWLIFNGLYTHWYQYPTSSAYKQVKTVRLHFKWDAPQIQSANTEVQKVCIDVTGLGLRFIPHPLNKVGSEPYLLTYKIMMISISSSVQASTCKPECPTFGQFLFVFGSIGCAHNASLQLDLCNWVFRLRIYCI